MQRQKGLASRAECSAPVPLTAGWHIASSYLNYARNSDFAAGVIYPIREEVAIEQEVFNGTTSGIERLIVANSERLLRNLLGQIEHALRQSNDVGHRLDRQVALIGQIQP